MGGALEPPYSAPPKDAMSQHTSRRSRTRSRAVIATLAVGLAAPLAFTVVTSHQSPEDAQTLSGTPSLDLSPARDRGITPRTASTLRMTVADSPLQTANGVTYAARRGFVGGHLGEAATQTIAGTADQAIYRQQYLAPTGWKSRVANGTYDVTLKMRESWVTAPGVRVFDVSAEGKPALSNVDIFAGSGRFTAYDRTFRVTVADGQLDLGFASKRGEVLISAIVVKPTNNTGGVPPAPTPNPSPTPTPKPTPTPTPTNPTPPSTTSPQAPAFATNAGYRNLTLSDDFDSPNSIDFSGTGASGYTWYTDMPWGYGVTPRSALNVANSVLTISQQSENYNFAISTVSAKTKNGKGFRYGYYEARLAFNPADATKSQGWPSFWAMSRDHMVGENNSRLGELDFFEGWHDAYSSYNQYFNGTVHDWNLTTSPKTDIGSYSNNRASLVGTDFNAFHTYGALWKPGSVTWYFDGRALFTQAYSSNGAPVPNPDGYGSGTFSILDKEPNGMGVILGSGVNYPMKVDWVRIWQ